MEMKMMTKATRILTAVAMGLAIVGSVSQASAQSVPHRHSGRQGYVERYYPPTQGNTQYPDYGNTGSGYSRGGCSDSPAEC
jgi:hypothetical protein